MLRGESFLIILYPTIVFKIRVFFLFTFVVFKTKILENNGGWIDGKGRIDA